MTIFRMIKEGEFDTLVALAKKHGLSKPAIGGCFVLEEDGDIRGFVNGGIVGLVETIVADTPQVAGRLFTGMEASLMTSLPNSQYYAMVASPMVGNLLKSQGWEKVQVDVYMKRRA